MSQDYSNKDPWKKDTLEIEGNFKLAIKANAYLDNPTEENLQEFKEEIEKSSSLAMGTVIEYLRKLVNSKQKVEECNLLISLILPKFEPLPQRNSVYDPMLGEFVYEDEEPKKKKM